MTTWGGAARFWAGGAVGFSEFPYSYIPGNTAFVTRARFDATYCYHWFIQNGLSLTPLAGRVLPSTIDVFLVAGGGRGHLIPGSGPAGGGAGGLTNLVLGHPAPTSGVSPIRGQRGSYTFPASPNGTQSQFQSLTSGGGGNGSSSGAGASNASFSGGSASGNAGGGGAGSAGSGSPGSGSTGGNGGPGVVNDWLDGTPRTYGRGGGGSGAPGITPGAPTALAQAGDGGPAGSDGAFGIVIVRYLRQY